MKPFLRLSIGVLGAVATVAEPHFVLESYGTDYHHLETGDVPVPDGLVNVQSASLSGNKETEVWGNNGDGEKDALLLGNEKLSGEVEGYADGF